MRKRLVVLFQNSLRRYYPSQVKGFASTMRLSRSTPVFPLVREVIIALFSVFVNIFLCQRHGKEKK